MSGVRISPAGLGWGPSPLRLSGLALKPRAEGAAALNGSQDTAFPRPTLSPGSLSHPSPQLPALLTSALFLLSPSSVPLAGATHRNRDRGAPRQTLLRLSGRSLPQDLLEEGR